MLILSKEMYQLIQKVATSVNRLENNLDSRFSILESKVEGSIRADERSREALNMADDAMKEAQQAKETARKVEERQLWLWGVVISGVVLGAIGALFFFAQSGVLGVS